jgi:hypothetical protein
MLLTVVSHLHSSGYPGQNHRRGGLRVAVRTEKVRTEKGTRVRVRPWFAVSMVSVSIPGRIDGRSAHGVTAFPFTPHLESRFVPEIVLAANHHSFNLKILCCPHFDTSLRDEFD